jgi:hypothetical protein
LQEAMNQGKIATPMTRARFCLVALVVLGTTQCGPSVAAVYEGKVRFEHCYRLDLDTNIAPTHREACWREWTERYTYGQTRDRLDYARRRIQALAAGDHRRPAMVSDEAGVAALPAEAPVPTSIHAPPPPLARTVLAPVVDAGAPDADAATPVTIIDAGPAPPGADCTPACETAWRACYTRCNADAGKKSTCGACKADYSVCLQRCLK